MRFTFTGIAIPINIVSDSTHASIPEFGGLITGVMHLHHTFQAL